MRSQGEGSWGRRTDPQSEDETFSQAHTKTTTEYTYADSCNVCYHITV